MRNKNPPDMRRVPAKAYGAEVSARRLSEDGDSARAARLSGRAPRTARCQVELNALTALAFATEAPAAAALQGRQAEDQLQAWLLSCLCIGLRSATKRHSVTITRCMRPLWTHAAGHCACIQRGVVAYAAQKRWCLLQGDKCIQQPLLQDIEQRPDGMQGRAVVMWQGKLRLGPCRAMHLAALTTGTHARSPGGQRRPTARFLAL